jgi:hypothetical protein
MFKIKIKGGEMMEPIILVTIVAILSIIIWEKKINPDTTWIYALYVLTIVIIFLIAVIIV